MKILKRVVIASFIWAVLFGMFELGRHLERNSSWSGYGPDKVQVVERMPCKKTMSGGKLFFYHDIAPGGYVYQTISYDKPMVK